MKTIMINNYKQGVKIINKLFNDNYHYKFKDVNHDDILLDFKNVFLQGEKYSIGIEYDSKEKSFLCFTKKIK